MPNQNLKIPIKSFLFVPGDSEKKLAKASESEAEALILDLEDSVSLTQKSYARQTVLNYLKAHPIHMRTKQIWVRINCLDHSEASEDLCAVIEGHPNGIFQPKANGPKDVERLSHYLDILETQHNLPSGYTHIIPIVTETAAAPFNLAKYTQIHLPRLYALTWGAEDLGTALGASHNQNTDGQFFDAFRLARSLCLLAAHASNLHAIETVYTDFHNIQGLKTHSIQSYAEGFCGRLAIHPVQIATINAAFSPSASMIKQAQDIIKAFDQAGEHGVIALDGKMLDRPHLKQARYILAQAGLIHD